MLSYLSPAHAASWRVARRHFADCALCGFCAPSIGAGCRESSIVYGLEDVKDERVGRTMTPEATTDLMISSTGAWLPSFPRTASRDGV